MVNKYHQREQDWRVGAVIYQVLVDRFAPANDLSAKIHLYPQPKTLHAWHEQPIHGEYLEEAGLWSHEIAFWGGDLNSLQARLPYLTQLGVDVLYLNPINEAYTNHKYDALDYQQVSPEYGTREDLTSLASALHNQGLKLVLDGVFNHMGQHATLFKSASSNTDSEYRDWFNFSSDYHQGYRAWENALNLPELNLENPAVRQHIYDAPDSVVQSYLVDNDVDGWRLDVAFDLGFEYLHELTEAAHRAKPNSLVVGEIWNYPDQWLQVMDGVMNFSCREIILSVVRTEISAKTALDMLQQLIQDCDYDGLLRSWLVLDNHDTPRLKNLLSQTWQQRLAQLLQFTLPGSPNLYYGVELGMTGGTDPEMRAPMAWHDVAITPDQEVDFDNIKNVDAMSELLWCRQLIALRKSHRALVIGDFKPIVCERLLAFERCTDQIEDSCFVVINLSEHEVTDKLLLPNAKLMNNAPLEDMLGMFTPPLKAVAGMLTVSVPAHGAMILKPIIADKDRQYSPYKRV